MKMWKNNHNIEISNTDLQINIMNGLVDIWKMSNDCNRSSLKEYVDINYDEFYTLYVKEGKWEQIK